MENTITVLIVDDSAFNRQTFKTILEKEPGVEVIGVASNGMDAMSKVLRLKPDLITLDFEMPEMDGITFLRWVMSEAPTKVIMVSSHSDSKTVFKALELGAMDFVVKPTSKASVELKNIERDLLEKVRGVREMNMEVMSKNLEIIESKTERHAPGKTMKTDIHMLAIGSSTGGPSALQVILSDLPRDIPCAIVISQHMPRGFTAPLAERLDGLCSISVREAVQGAYISAGEAAICPGGFHMSFISYGEDVQINLTESSEEDKYTPSVDQMMTSASEIYPGKTMGIVLTGMGNDGSMGLKDIRMTGGATLAESEETAVVFGMPNEAIKANAVETVLPLNMIAAEIRKVVIGERRR